MKDFFSKCDQIRRYADLVTFIGKILNGKLNFLRSVSNKFKNLGKKIDFTSGCKRTI